MFNNDERGTTLLKHPMRLASTTPGTNIPFLTSTICPLLHFENRSAASVLELSQLCLQTFRLRQSFDKAKKCGLYSTTALFIATYTLIRPCHYTAASPK